jgi:hypothetical protein
MPKAKSRLRPRRKFREGGSPAGRAMAQDDADSALPPGWTKHWSNSWQKHYWFNTKTGKQSWEHPGAAGAEAAQGAPASQPSAGDKGAPAAQTAAGDKRKAPEPAAAGDAGSPRPPAAAMPCAPRLSLFVRLRGTAAVEALRMSSRVVPNANHARTRSNQQGSPPWKGWGWGRGRRSGRQACVPR